MTMVQQLAEQIQSRFSATSAECIVAVDEVTLIVAKEQLLAVCQALRDEEPFLFEELIDVCGVDYSEYGCVEWVTESATSTGFERGVTREKKLPFVENKHPQRYAAVYHLLSLAHNHRLRLRVYTSEEDMRIPSVHGIWNSANWFEREAFDLFGIMFEGHPDLRRILTDYGFIGHPFRKDFPLIGNVEMRYDEANKRVIYEPVSIEPRTLVPRTIRHYGDHADEKREQGS